MDNSSCYVNTPTTATSGASSQIGALLAEQMAMLDIDETPMAQSEEEGMVDCLSEQPPQLTQEEKMQQLMMKRFFTQ